MKTKYGDISLKSNEDGKSLTIVLSSDHDMNLDRAIDLLGALIHEMGRQLRELKGEKKEIANIKGLH